MTPETQPRASVVLNRIRNLLDIRACLCRSPIPPEAENEKTLRAIMRALTQPETPNETEGSET